MVTQTIAVYAMQGRLLRATGSLTFATVIEALTSIHSPSDKQPFCNVRFVEYARFQPTQLSRTKTNRCLFTTVSGSYFGPRFPTLDKSHPPCLHTPRGINRPKLCWAPARLAQPNLLWERSCRLPGRWLRSVPVSCLLAHWGPQSEGPQVRYD